MASNAAETITIPSTSTSKGGPEAAWIAVAFASDPTSTTTHTSAKTKPGKAVKAGKSCGNGSKIVLYSPKSETPLCSRDIRVEVSSMVFMPGATIHSLSSPGMRTIRVFLSVKYVFLFLTAFCYQPLMSHLSASIYYALL